MAKGIGVVGKQIRGMITMTKSGHSLTISGEPFTTKFDGEEAV